MICPNCGASVPDGALWCTHCHAELAMTQQLKLRDVSWCPVCGALVPAGADSCPKCGASLKGPDAVRRRTRKIDLPQIGNTGVMDAIDATAGKTSVMTRIESAIPPASDEQSAEAVHDRIPHVRAFVFAAVLAVVVVGGTALAITHPWNPNASNISATTPADTHLEGFPGTVDALSGQDKRQTGANSSQEGSSDEQPTLSDYYSQLKDLADKIDKNEETLLSDGLSKDADARSAGQSDLTQVSIEVSNLITKTDQLAADYGDAAKNLSTLGNWLRNRCDALARAWAISVASADPSKDESKIRSAADESDSYKALFDKNYQDWDPAA